MQKINSSYNALKFFIPTYVLTWSFWFSTRLNPGPHVNSLLFILGLLCPAIVGVFLIFTSRDKRLISVFLDKIFNIRLIQISTLPYLILIPPVSIIAAIIISLLFGYSIQQLTIAKSFTFSIASMPTLLILFLAACFEELGWRGYGMESLMNNYNYFKSTCIFSIIWAMWHFPLFFVVNSYHYNILQLNPIFALNFMIGVIPFAFIINWLWKKNNYNILIAISFHFIANITQELFLVDPVTKCIQTLVYFCIAIFILYNNKEMFIRS